MLFLILTSFPENPARDFVDLEAVRTSVNWNSEADQIARMTMIRIWLYFTCSSLNASKTGTKSKKNIIRTVETSGNMYLTSCVKV